MTSTESWRGVATEDMADIDKSVGLKLQARSRKLLRELLRPHLGVAILAMLLVIAEQLASLAGPMVIAAAIDAGIPDATRGDTTVLAWCVGGYIVSALGSAGLRALYMLLAGRIGQDVLIELRQRLFVHAQRLSLSFHEKYTSGRVISRITSDVDSIKELVDDALEGMLSAVLSVVGIGVMLLVLDVPLALVVLLGFLPLIYVTRRFYRRSQETYRGTSSAIAKIIVQFVESMNGMRAVQAFQRGQRNEAIMGELNDGYRAAHRHAFGLVATYTMTVRLVGNLTLAVVLAIGAWRVIGLDLELGVLTAFTLYLRRFYDPLDDMAMFANTYSAASAALEKISGTTVASMSRLHSDHSDCSAAIGCTATALRMVDALASDSPRWRTFPSATREAIAPTVSSMGTEGSTRCW